jgi:hypothetical protein
LAVYFVRAGATQMVKIGHTNRDVADRVRELQTSNPEPLSVICVVEGDETVEANYHRRYMQYWAKAQNEWFEFPEHIIEEIRHEQQWETRNQRPVGGPSPFDVRPVRWGQQHQIADPRKDVPESSWGADDSQPKRLFTTRR